MPMQAVDIPTSDGVMDAKLFFPEGQGSWPGVVMISDAGGSRPTYDKMAQRLADAGYVVLLPHVYYRAGRAQLPQLVGATMADENFRKTVMGLMATLTPERVRKDGEAELDFLAAQPQVKGKGLGVVGYCMGGAVAMRMMAHRPEQVVAAASYHGGFLATDDANSPHLLADKLKGELYFGHADQDQFMDAQAIARLDEALTKAGVRYKAEVYTGAHHGYAVQGSPSFSQQAADKHWQTMLELFGRTLRA